MSSLKRLVVTSLCVMVVSTPAWAAPITGFEKGDVTVDVIYRPNLDVEATTDLLSKPDFNPEPKTARYTTKYDKFTFDADGFDSSIAIGLGHNWAIQYRQYDPKVNNDAPFELNTREINVVHKFNDNFSAFVGAFEYKTQFYARGDYEVYTKAKNTPQLGVIANYDICKNTIAYGGVTIGNGYRSWETGLSYKINDKLNFNVDYRDMKIDDINVAKDVKVKGFGVGISGKF